MPLSKIYDSLLTLAYPQACQICEQSVENLSDGIACRACWNITSVFSGSETLCLKCGRFLLETPSDSQVFCHQCEEHFYDSASAVGIYELALSASILNLKREPFVARKLKDFFLNRFQQSAFQNITKIIPVPLSKNDF